MAVNCGKIEVKLRYIFLVPRLYTSHEQQWSKDMQLVAHRTLEQKVLGSISAQDVLQKGCFDQLCTQLVGS